MVQVGDRVKMRTNHWCRPGSRGVVVSRESIETASIAENRLLVKFDKKGVGLGGEYLFVDPEELEVIPDAKP